MKRIISYIIVTLCLSQLVCGQNILKLNYGGVSGKRFNGMVQVSYVVINGNRTYKLPDTTTVINLNKYKGPVQFGFQLSELKLGLNNSFSKVKNKIHPKVYYIEGSRGNVDIEGYTNTGIDTIKISAGSGHYSKHEGRLKYIINNIESKKNILFQAKIRIVDGVDDRFWTGPIISKNIIFLPKTKVEEKNKKNNSDKKKEIRPNRYRYKKDTEKSIEKDTLNTSVDELIWTKIENDLINDNETSLFDHCSTYLKICDQYITNGCEHLEDVLFYFIQLSDPSEKITHIDRYKNQFSEGKYISAINNLTIKKEIPTDPIHDQLAHIDNDSRVIIVNRILGGKKPYYIGFFDINKSKKHPIKSIRFSKKNMMVRLNDLKISEGNYDIKVYDAKGNLFITKKNIPIRSDFSIPKSIKLSFMLLLIGILFFLYKRYIMI